MHLSIDTVLPADSVEFCPHPDASNVFVCGTYKLQDKRDLQPSDSVSTTSGPADQIRTGQCLVFEVDVDSEQDIRACAARTFVLSMSPEIKGETMQVEDPGDIPSCDLGHEMVRTFPPPVGSIRERIVPRCHTTPSRRPLIAVADSEGNVNLFEWDFEQVP